MLSRGELVAATLREWEGTPFHPQAKLKGTGCDCKGLLWGVAEELGFPEAQSGYATFLEYNLGAKHGVSAAHLREGFNALFDRADDLEPGDILLCKWGGHAGHIAIYAGDGRAWSSLPNAGVKCRTLRSLYHRFPLDSAWRWRQLGDS